jgi:hypothetical protein
MAENKIPAATTKSATNLFASLKANAKTVEPAMVFVDKSKLVGKPFVIKDWTMVPSTSSIRNVLYAQVNFVLEDGTEGTFRDSSRYGVRQQLADHLGVAVDKVPVGVLNVDPILVADGLVERKFKSENSKGNEIDSVIYTL